MIQLTAKKIQAAQLLASGRKCQDVAAEVDVTPQTISQWKREAGFTVYINRFKLESAETALDSFRSLAKDAADELGHLLKNSKSDETRRKVAISILEMIGLYGTFHLE
jgi:transposase-like protein